MDKLERAYYLGGEELLLLLSLNDGGPMWGFPLPSPESLDRQTIETAAFSLEAKGWLEADGRGIYIKPDRAGIAARLKGARRVLFAASPRALRPPVALYLGGAGITTLERLAENAFRLTDTAGEEAVWEFLDLPERPVSEEELPSLGGGPEASELSRWENSPYEGAPVELWRGVPQARTVVELYVDGVPSGRWVWLEDRLCNLLLTQDANGNRACPDALSARRAALKIWEGED